MPKRLAMPGCLRLPCDHGVLGREYPTAEGVASIPLRSSDRLRASRPCSLLEFDRGARVAFAQDRSRGFRQSVAQGAAYAEKALGIDRLLLRSELCAEAGRIFLDRYGELIELSASGQLAMRRVLEEHLEASGVGFVKFPCALSLRLRRRPSEVRSIVIESAHLFRQTVHVQAAISTSAVADESTRERRLEDLPPTTTLTLRNRAGRAQQAGRLVVSTSTDCDLGKRFPEILNQAGLNAERHAVAPRSNSTRKARDRARRIVNQSPPLEPKNARRFARGTCRAAAQFPQSSRLSWRHLRA